MAHDLTPRDYHECDLPPQPFLHRRANRRIGCNGRQRPGCRRRATARVTARPRRAAYYKPTTRRRSDSQHRILDHKGTTACPCVPYAKNGEVAVIERASGAACVQTKKSVPRRAAGTACRNPRRWSPSAASSCASGAGIGADRDLTGAAEELRRCVALWRVLSSPHSSAGSDFRGVIFAPGAQQQGDPAAVWPPAVGDGV